MNRQKPKDTEEREFLLLANRVDQRKLEAWERAAALQSQQKRKKDLTRRFYAAVGKMALCGTGGALVLLAAGLHLIAPTLAMYLWCGSLIALGSFAEKAFHCARRTQR